VWASFHRGITACSSPVWGFDFTRNAWFFHVLQHAGCGVREISDVTREVCWSAKTAYRVFPALGPKKRSRAIDIRT
jgi:hypothetical protein